jgi:predicted restriction endonuclease
MLSDIELYIRNFIKKENIDMKQLYILLKNKFCCDNNATYTIHKINFIMYDMFQYIHTEEKTSEETLKETSKETLKETSEETLEDKIKRKDNKFKKLVKSYYKTCVITGRSEHVCEVAHIFPFSDSELKDKYNQYNGILLCRDLHHLFDNKLIIIDPVDYKLTLSDIILNDNTLIDYKKYHNMKLNIRKESKIYFEKFYNK